MPGIPHISLALLPPTLPFAPNPNSPSAPGGLNFTLTPFFQSDDPSTFRIAVTMLATRFGDGTQQQLTLNIRWAVVTRS
jgi:hypothetical protein